MYDALSKGDVPGVLAKHDPEVIVDEPDQLPYGGVHQGHEVFVQSILGVMMGYADVAITDAEVYEGPAGVIGTLTGTLTAHTTGEQYPLTMPTDDATQAVAVADHPVRHRHRGGARQP